MSVLLANSSSACWFLLISRSKFFKLSAAWVLSFTSLDSSLTVFCKTDLWAVCFSIFWLILVGSISPPVNLPTLSFIICCLSPNPILPPLVASLKDISDSVLISLALFRNSVAFNCAAPALLTASINLLILSALKLAAPIAICLTSLAAWDAASPNSSCSFWASRSVFPLASRFVVASTAFLIASNFSRICAFTCSGRSLVSDTNCALAWVETVSRSAPAFSLTTLATAPVALRATLSGSELSSFSILLASCCLRSCSRGSSPASLGRTIKSAILFDVSCFVFSS